MTNVPNITLNNGITTPQLGLGTYQAGPAGVVDAVSYALEVGYRSLDTAAVYGNETGIGEAIARSGLDRAELFVTTKLWNDKQGYDSTMRAFDTSLAKLGLDYVDLYLIHWPLPDRDQYVETWQAFEKIAVDGRARSIGVSNFQIPHLQRLFDETPTVPAINQIELSPRVTQAPLRRFHAQHNIATEAWGPLARGELLRDATLAEIAGRYGKTPAQVVLRWHIELGNVVIPKSVTPSRIKENFEIFDFSLTSDEVAAISGLETGERTGPHPDEFTK